MLWICFKRTWIPWVLAVVLLGLPFTRCFFFKFFWYVHFVCLFFFWLHFWRRNVCWGFMLFWNMVGVWQPWKLQLVFESEVYCYKRANPLPKQKNKRSSIMTCRFNFEEAICYKNSFCWPTLPLAWLIWTKMWASIIGQLRQTIIAWWMREIERSIPTGHLYKSPYSSQAVIQYVVTMISLRYLGLVRS